LHGHFLLAEFLFDFKERAQKTTVFSALKSLHVKRLYYAKLAYL